MSRSDRIMLAAGGGALVLVAAAAWMLLAPSVGAPPVDTGTTLFTSSSGQPIPAASEALGGTIVVDVQGGVAEPGIRELPAGSRLADAIDAAGGYAVDADLEAAAALNLAEPLADGGQIRVPRIGDAVAAAGPSAAPAPGGGQGTGTGTGMVDLEALPGIGPVTVQKIVAARTERPFASLEDAVERGVLNRGQLEDIQGVATAG
jgi:competence protein ComEA